MGLEDSVNSEHSINSLPILWKEMKDIDSVEQFIVNYQGFCLLLTDKISIIGHSKGGVSALLYCTQYNKNCESMHLASPFDRSWNSKFIHKWRSQGVQYIKNARTNQMMPMNIEVLEDMEINKSTVWLMLVKASNSVFDYSRNK
jgi:hypothetical protein